MGALPSRETHQRGLYSHRHGRNRRSEIILIPLTTTFFPSPDCALFQHLYNARNRRTVKYYLRAPRCAETSMESDYYCNTVRANDSDFDKFNRERLETERQQQKQQSQPCHAQTGGTNFKSHVSSPLGVVANGRGGHFDCCMLEEKPLRKSAIGDYDYQSYSDTPEGLYHVLIQETDLCVADTDQELRDEYVKQVEQQRMELGRDQKGSRSKLSASTVPMATEASHISPLANAAEYHTPQLQTPPSFMQGNMYPKDMGLSGGSVQPQDGVSCPEPSTPHRSFVPDVSLSGAENISFDAFIAGYAAAKRYMKGKHQHTCCRAVNPNGVGGGDRFGMSTTTRVPIGVQHNLPKGASLPADPANPRKYVKHVTSPAAYYLHPVPCAIASRYVDKKPPAPDDPYCVQFEGFFVRIMGMFGLFPATVPMRYRTSPSEPSCDAARAQSLGKREEGAAEAPLSALSSAAERSRLRPRGCRAVPRKEGHPNSDDELDDETEIGQHLLKGTMFVDKDVGDQILGNMVMLAAHMYVRQCIEARIQPQYIPMLPFFMRFPLSNIPMLQFVREFRLRLRTLLEAGTARSGQKPMHVGLSGINPDEIVEEFHPQQLRSEAEGYLFEEDIPDVETAQELFLDDSQHQELLGALKRSNTNTNPGCHFPIMMISGFNIQHTPLRHPALNATKHRRRASALQPPRPVRKASWVGAGGVPATGGVGMGGMPAATQPPPSDLYGLSYPPPPLPPRTSSQVLGFSCGLPELELGVDAEAAKRARLLRRKQRFRMWVEDGYVCVWASAAYARRACLLLAQQLNTTVDGTALPGMRSWRYCGLLHAGSVVPRPVQANDVLIVAEDIPSTGLWQGDVLRCSTAEETLAWQKGQPLPLPGLSVGVPQGSPRTSETKEPETGFFEPTSAASPGKDAAAGLGMSRLAFVFLQEPDLAPPGAIWVRGSGGLDDSFTDVMEPTRVAGPKLERQMQQAAQQQTKKRAVVVGRCSRCGSSTKETMGTTPAAGFNLLVEGSGFDTRGGALQVEEVILSWMRGVYLQTREVREDNQGWLFDPSGRLVRLDRYTFFRFEHDGMRFFIGSTTRFIGQQQRIEKVLGELNAMEREQQNVSSNDENKMSFGGTVESLTCMGSTDYLFRKERCSCDPSRDEKTFSAWGLSIDVSQALLEAGDDDDDEEDMFHLKHVGYDEYLISDE